MLLIDYCIVSHSSPVYLVERLIFFSKPISWTVHRAENPSQVSRSFKQRPTHSVTCLRNVSLCRLRLGCRSSNTRGTIARTIISVWSSLHCVCKRLFTLQRLWYQKLFFCVRDFARTKRTPVSYSLGGHVQDTELIDVQEKCLYGKHHHLWCFRQNVFIQKRLTQCLMFLFFALHR